MSRDSTRRTHPKSKPGLTRAVDAEPNRSRVSCHAETCSATLTTGGCPETMRSPGDPLQRDASTRRLRVLSFRPGPKGLDDLEYTWIGTVSLFEGINPRTSRRVFPPVRPRIESPCGVTQDLSGEPSFTGWNPLKLCGCARSTACGGPRRSSRLLAFSFAAAKVPLETFKTRDLRRGEGARCAPLDQRPDCFNVALTGVLGRQSERHFFL
jgi:hypothetical protein